MAEPGLHMCKVAVTIDGTAATILIDCETCAGALVTIDIAHIYTLAKVCPAIVAELESRRPPDAPPPLDLMENVQVTPATRATLADGVVDQQFADFKKRVLN